MKNCIFLLQLLWLTAVMEFMLPVAFAQTPGAVVVLSESGFPAADSATPSQSDLTQAIPPSASLVTAEWMAAALAAPSTRVLVLPYGSAFPERLWPDIYTYLRRGGNLLVLGGQPFTRAAYRDAAGWHLRDYSVRFSQELFIDQYQTTPGSESLAFQTNPDITTQLPKFSWKRAFSPTIRLTGSELYKRAGAAGPIDARLEALAWGTKDGIPISAPAIQIDHVKGDFAGGRWIFVNSELDAGFYASGKARQLVDLLVTAALRGSEELIVRPSLPLYIAGEPIQLDVTWRSATQSESPLTLKIKVVSESGEMVAAQTVLSPLPQSVTVPVPATKGFHIVEANLLDGNRPRAIYRSGFWIRDESYLRSGPKLSVNKDYFELDGRPLAVVGTTYMASDVQRLFFEHPNVYLWDRDLRQIDSAGLNMIRTGWWTGWDKFCDEDGRPYERTLRTVEAFLMTARKHNLPVQFNFFAFLPEVLGGSNAYLDPEALSRQRTLISSIAGRFRDVPFVAWDLINEPSISERLWKTRPSGDRFELAQWNGWLQQRYPDPAALAHAWNLPSPGGTSRLPLETEFEPRGMYAGQNSLKLYDYHQFAQDTFAAWVREMRACIRATGSQQAITVGQDEGGFQGRPSPAFFAESVDFTTNHSWWQNDDLLWDSLVAKQPGKAMLIQETGIQRELMLDETMRRTAENEAALLERKMAMSFVQGSGAIQWLWHSNAYMSNSNEAPIGALRSDGTHKPEAFVMRDFARFAASIRGSLRDPQAHSVAVVTSQTAEFSVFSNLQLEAQRKAVRALNYYARVPGYIVAENRIEELGSPKLVILPSPQALDEVTWQRLLTYVRSGGNLLVTGPVERDPHWRYVARAVGVNLDAALEPLTYRNAEIRLGRQSVPLSFDSQKQTWLEALRFKQGSGFRDLAHGKGRIFWASYPVELAEGLEPTAKLYSYVLEEVGITAPFEYNAKLSPGVLIYPTVMADSVLYVMTSESATDSDIDVRDKLTGAKLQFRLASQHAALAVIRKSDGTMIAKYGF